MTFVSSGLKRNFSKNWDLRHTEDISAATFKIHETLATSSYVGELILWRLETGQPYKKFNVSDPTARIKIHYTLKHKDSKPKDEMIRRRPSLGKSKVLPIDQTSEENAMLPGEKCKIVIFPLFIYNL